MRFYRSVLLIALSISLSLNSKSQTLDKGFLHPPDSVRTGVFWHWVSDNISKEGVVKDLYSMKKVGITLAFIGFTGPSTHHNENYPYGNVKFMSPEWWDVLHTALKTASELGIEIGIFNSAGWSQSGGPWVKPEESMRYLSAAEVHSSGSGIINLKLPTTAKDFKDVRVLAFPSVRKNLFDTPGSTIKLSDNLSKVDTGYKLPSTVSSIILHLPASKTVRGILIYPGSYLNAHCSLQVLENGVYRTVKEFNADRDASMLLSKGFDQRSPVVESFPDVVGSDFKLVFTESTGNSSMASIVLTPDPVIQRYPGKTFAKIEDAGSDPSIATDPSLFVDANKVVDISKYMSADGTLDWNAPKGEWTIMRMGMVTTGILNSPAPPEATGLEVDKLNKEYIVNHFNAFLGEIYKRIPAADRKCWTYTVLDSYEKGGQNMTDGMLEKFKQHYGYDPVPYLPALYGYPIGNLQLSERFLWDMRRFVADLIAYQYVAGLTESSHKFGLKTWLENYGHGGFSAEFLQYGGQADEIGGEFWTNKHTYEKRDAASCAHTYGKNLVWAEAYTNDGRDGSAWQRYPGMLKQYGDLAFAEGINAMLLHVFISQYSNNDYPGVDAWYGTEFNRKNTYFNQIDDFVKYTRRTSFMLQQGRNVADVAYYIGENTPMMSPAMQPAMPKGYNFDFINSELLIRDLAVKNKQLVLPSGTTYKLLVLPQENMMRPDVLKKLEKLVADGATIIGLPPNQSPSLQNYPAADKEIQQLATKMWGSIDVTQSQTSGKIINYGKGTILQNTTIDKAFELLKVRPDCGLNQGDPIVYTHRCVGQTDIYFISNQSNQAVHCAPIFRVANKQPELWNAVSGTNRVLPSFTQSNGSTNVPLELAPGESVFVVFRSSIKSTAKGPAANYATPKTIAEVKDPWLVKFESDEIKRGPVQPELLDHLSDWSLSENPQIKYYSGSANYVTDLILNNAPTGKMYLDLGQVYVMAKVKVNGKDVGGVWTAPYRLDVTGTIKKGTNKIEIEVVSTWLNRILGDRLLPENERKLTPHTTPWSKDTPLQKSGLLGPVRLLSIND